MLVKLVKCTVLNQIQCLAWRPTYTDQIFSRPIFASYTDKTWSQWLHLNNSTHAYPFCKTTPGSYLDVAIAKKSRNSLLICSTFATIFAKLLAGDGRESIWSV